MWHIPCFAFFRLYYLGGSFYVVFVPLGTTERAAGVPTHFSFATESRALRVKTMSELSSGLISPNPRR